MHPGQRMGNPRVADRSDAKIGRMRSAGMLLLIGLASACGGDAVPTIAPPDGPATGTLLVLETRPCNWLQPGDPNKCDAVGLVRIGLDGEVQQVVTPRLPMALRSFALSSDGGRIAWAWNWEVAIAEVDGAGVRVVNAKVLDEGLGETALDPAWSPDGSELTYWWTGATGEEGWYRVDVENGDMAKVDLPVDCRAMALAPGGGRMACEVERDPEGDSGRTLADLYLVDLETNEATALTDPDDTVGNGRPEWSPDGRWLAFARWTDDAGASAELNGIWVLEIETGAAVRVAPGAISVPVWSPDGGHIAAYDQVEGRIIIVGRDGSGLTTVDHEPRRFTAPRWLPED